MQKKAQSKSFIDEGYRCSFCSRHESEVNKLVLGPDVYICDACVDVCLEIVRDETGALNSLDPRRLPADESARSVDQAVLWRRLDRPGYEFARLSWRDYRWILAGAAVFDHEQQPCRLDYVVVCDKEWQTLSGRVHGWVGNSPVAAVLASDSGRRWWLNGKECPEVAGCIDLDLNFSPSTNLLPIRRLELPIGSEAAVKAAWLRFPGFTLEPLDQLYRRTGATTYRYESAGGKFATELEVSETGLVTRYPNFCEIEGQQ